MRPTQKVGKDWLDGLVDGGPHYHAPQPKFDRCYHTVKGEKLLLQAVPWPPYVPVHATPTHMHTKLVSIISLYVVCLGFALQILLIPQFLCVPPPPVPLTWLYSVPRQVLHHWATSPVSLFLLFYDIFLSFILELQKSSVNDIRKKSDPTLNWVKQGFPCHKCFLVHLFIWIACCICSG